NTLKNYKINNKEKLFLSIVLRKRSSLSEEPTNLYVKNLPHNWNEHQILELFRPYGKVLQYKLDNDGIAFIRYENHTQALLAVDNLNGKLLYNSKLEVKFANRKPAAIMYKTGQIQNYKNQNNVYI